MNLQQLYYFRAIAEASHFTKAAEKLGITQSNLSHSISNLEDELGVLLFTRQGRNVVITKQGRDFLKYVKTALDSLEEGKKMLAGNTAASDTISISHFNSLTEFVPYLLTRYVTATGDLTTRFHTYEDSYESLANSIIDGKINFSVMTYIPNDELSGHLLGSHELVLIVSASHPFADLDEIDLAELRDERLITYDNRSQVRQYIDNVFENIGIRPEIVLAASHDSIILSSVAADFGIALVPKPLNKIRPDIVAISIKNDMPPRDVFLVWKRSKQISQTSRKFRNFVVNEGLMLDEFCLKLRAAHRFGAQTNLID